MESRFVSRDKNDIWNSLKFIIENQQFIIVFTQEEKDFALKAESIEILNNGGKNQGTS